ncbi:hypothetical protein FNV43_RR07510 [Rhamnella rubrinervis]|uniref:Uncharacterized protein n=1 Tax=Rhamnella rubrinervis TaxID=2594499 RepID=A0A8K0MN23_9ROSA|nr:hypothetical protein FNV43_RR07510 [Rhamnella rubrinervis]
MEIKMIYTELDHFQFLPWSYHGKDKTKHRYLIGVFEFLLELTTDASMEITELDGRPNLWYMVGAYVSCFLLLTVQSCRRSYVSGRRNDCVDRQETCPELPEMGFSAESDRRRCGSESIIRVVESRGGVLDGQTIEEDGHNEADGLRRRKRKAKQEIRSSFSRERTRQSTTRAAGIGMGITLWTSTRELYRVTKPTWEFSLDRALTSTVSQTCKLMW